MRCSDFKVTCVAVTLKSLGRKVYLDICCEPLQRLTHDGRNSGLARAGRATPETRDIRLEIFSLHDVAQLVQALAVICKGRDKPHQSFKIIDQISARNFTARAEVLHSGFPDDLWVMWTGPILLTLSIGPRRLLLNDARNFIRVECVAGKTQRGKRSTATLTFRCRYCRAHRRAHP
jgi:hypothetical protein